MHMQKSTAARLTCGVLTWVWLLAAVGAQAQESPYWNAGSQLTPFRLAPAPAGYAVQRIDLDDDGDPDLLKTVTLDGTPVLWIDDDDDMKATDREGDSDADCLLIDRNRDGRYGGIGDLIVDRADTDADQHPDMELIADYPPAEKDAVWPNGHYMWILDTDHDGVFNYVDWNTLTLQSWAHSGQANFFPDYNGRSIFMKVHAATNRIEDARLNWENPFLFYDPDGDGLTEMAVRLVDSTSYFDDPGKTSHPQTIRFSGKINWASISVDLDNDNGPGNELDFDFTLGLRGGGFDYMDQVHPFPRMGGLAAADSFFLDAGWRHMDTLIYADHEHALPLIFKRGTWKQIYFVYDEDDDCHRWERVEFLDPLDPFKIGTGKKGIDNNPQADPAGDRGEWDLDNSGGARLYLSRFDGRLHLYGAEWGCWRIDQEAAAYQGWDRRIIKAEPRTFATVKYEDADRDGFFDRLSYDLDGDTSFETVVDLAALGLDDHCPLIDVSGFQVADYQRLHRRMADSLWQHATLAMHVAGKFGLDLGWYARYRHPASERQRYAYGYWLQFYIYKDLEHLFLQQGSQAMLTRLARAYYGGDWNALLR